ncbi:hypothetical protein [Paraburkholderia strydomiana]|uniref:hypothetical protein n=1 Tax=Paraburkholderia strydomiana TaxID=1245417 RepID=UPI0038B904CC
MEAWFDEKKLELKASTEAGWTRTVRNLLLPQLANLLLIERTRESIVSWLRSLDVGRKRPMSNKRLASIQTVLRQALAIAVERKLVDVNPLASYTYSRKISVRVSTFDLEALAVKDRVDPFSTEEQRAAETTKTTAGRREVKLLRPALEALAAQKRHT